MTYEALWICEACGKVVGEDDTGPVSDDLAQNEHIHLHESCALANASEGDTHGKECKNL